MKFRIENRPVFSQLVIDFVAGEVFRAEGGAMVSMSPTIELKAKTAGKGFLGAIGAMVGGESLFASEYTAIGGAGELVLAPAAPGDIMQFDLQNRTIFAESGAYLAGSPELLLTTQGSLKAMISGEGMFLQKISGSGTLFLCGYGAIVEKQLAAGEHYIVDAGHIIAFEDGVTYTIKKAAKGLFSTLASGEGLVCNYQGPGKIWIQTRNLKGFAAMIQKLIMPQH